MALLSAEERKRIPLGVNAKHKCDRCKKVIVSTLIYATKDGLEACSQSCRDSLDKEIEINLNRGQNKMAKKSKHDEDEDTKKKGKSDEDEEEEEEETEEEEEEESSDEDDEDEDEEEEKPKKKRGRPAKKEKVEKKKAKKSKKSKDDEDEEEEEEDEKPSKKDKKKKKAKKDDDDDDEKPKRKVVTGTKENPFREGSSIATAFDKVRKGISVKDFKAFAKKEGHDFGWYMARFRKEEKRGVKWSFSEDDDDLKLTLKKKK